VNSFDDPMRVATGLESRSLTAGRNKSGSKYSGDAEEEPEARDSCGFIIISVWTCSSQI
jgi:hypothetical protein